MSERTAQSWYSIRAQDNGRASVYLYDEIGYWGITAKDFVRELNRLDVAAIDLFVNSPGGDVFDGYAIYNALKSHKATVTTMIDGLAASAASYIAQAGDRVVMAKPATMMIHNARGVTLGDAPEHQKMADQLGQIDSQIAAIYAERSGTPAEDWRARMTEESWYTSEEAVAVGLADEVAASAPANSLTSGRIFDLSKFHRVPPWVARSDAKEQREEGEPSARNSAAGVDSQPVAKAAAAGHEDWPYLAHHNADGTVHAGRLAVVRRRVRDLNITIEDRAVRAAHLEQHARELGV